MGSGWDLEGVAGDGGHVVASHHAPVATGQHAVEGSRGGAPRGDTLARRTGEPRPAAREERRQEGVERLQGADAVQRQFGGQAVLEGLPVALDAALGFGAVSRDVADAELLEHLAELGGLLAAGELFGERPVAVVAHRDPGAVAIERLGHPAGGDEIPQRLGKAVQVFVRTSHQAEQLAAGIVERADQREGRMVLPEPGELGAVDQHQTADAAGTQPPAMVARRTPPPLGGEPQRPSDQSHRLGADRDAALGQQVTQVAVVQLRLGVLEQRDHLLAHRRLEPP